jgi:hypothetical protein
MIVRSCSPDSVEMPVVMIEVIWYINIYMTIIHHLHNHLFLYLIIRWYQSSSVSSSLCYIDETIMHCPAVLATKLTARLEDNCLWVSLSVVSFVSSSELSSSLVPSSLCYIDETIMHCPAVLATMLTARLEDNCLWVSSSSLAIVSTSFIILMTIATMLHHHCHHNYLFYLKQAHY